MTEKKIPLRMCIICKEMKAKADLQRIVKLPNGDIVIDKTGKTNGRGCYVCNSQECMEKCIKKKMLNKAFKCAINDEVYARLAEEYGLSQNS